MTDKIFIKFQIVKNNDIQKTVVFMMFMTGQIVHVYLGSYKPTAGKVTVMSVETFAMVQAIVSSLIIT